MRKTNSLATWLLIIIILLVIVRITPLQRLNPLATPRDCMPIVLNGDTDPGATDAYKQHPIQTALFGTRCVTY